MMKVCVLASGSKGNVTYIEAGTHKFLIDLGTTVKNIEEKLNSIGVSLSEIEAVFISHIHSDHIKALESFLKASNASIYMTQGMIDELDNQHPIKTSKHLVLFDDTVYLNEVKIENIKTSHDVKDSRGFLVTYEGKKVLYLTDSGYVNQKYFRLLRNCQLYLFESNHDAEMLMNGPYPKWLKDRVVGPYGHLSNRDASVYLAKLVGNETQQIVLMHLSEHNNTEDKAMETIHSIFQEYGVEFNQIVCAKQNERSAVFEL